MSISQKNKFLPWNENISINIYYCTKDYENKNALYSCYKFNRRKFLKLILCFDKSSADIAMYLIKHINEISVVSLVCIEQYAVISSSPTSNVIPIYANFSRQFVKNIIQ